MNVCIYLVVFYYEVGEEEKLKYYLEKVICLIEEKGYYYLNEGFQVFKVKLEIVRGEFEVVRVRFDMFFFFNN